MIELHNEALKYYGLSEVEGKKVSNPTIKTWMRWALSWYTGDDSELAWCGIFMGVLFRDLGMSSQIPAHLYRARSWMSVGTEVSLSEAKKGDIVIYWRGSVNDGRSGHVHIYDHETISNIYGLGGNQGNKVSIAPYKKEKLLKIVRVSEVSSKSVSNLSFVDKMLLRLVN